MEMINRQGLLGKRLCNKIMSITISNRSSQVLDEDLSETERRLAPSLVCPSLVRCELVLVCSKLWMAWMANYGLCKQCSVVQPVPVIFSTEI